MSSEHIFITLLISVVAFLLYQKRQQHERIKETLRVLEEITAGNENCRIHVGAKEPLAPLIFKINQLVDAYQKDKIKIYRSEQVRKQMLSNLAHDVRTPLTSVLGYLDALCQGIAEEEAEEYLHIAKNKADAMKEYLDELFTMAQIDANEMILLSEPIDLFELLRSELISWAPKLHREKITLEIGIPDDECFVTGDQHAITRIFNNLLQNAYRYGSSKRFMGVAAWSDDDSAYFEVWDKGPGLSPEELSRVFTRLYKSDASRSAKGHGLGLAIAKELVQKMKGKIIMESEQNIKTSVRVCLPKSKKK